ncbi:hypothetical protein [Amycolatopsis sp. NPDC051371]|uniref:hypothetical protein n=1 Tax=Amycolatopsis sp. NPDC051371 TaxID=3155800 RepID=UPI00341F6EE5
MRNLLRTALIVSAAGAAATIAVVSAQGAENSAVDEPPSLAEDYTYPGAAQILATDHVQLISGDGHIVYAACPTGPDTVGLLQISTSERVGPRQNGKVCFHVLGSGGQLSLKLPGVYSIRGDGLSTGQGHKVKAALTTDAGQHTTVDVPPDGTTQVGIAGTPAGDPTTLLELNATT